MPVYPVLRAATAGGALASGFVQTYVFARVLSPEQFSIYIVIASLGLSLWLFDLGVAKVLFVELRHAFLKDRLRRGAEGEMLPAQAAGIALIYAVIVGAGALLCFTIVAAGTSRGALEATHEALLFAYTALNLVWFVLRNVSVAGDQFIFFESIDAVRRIGHISLIFCLFLPISFMSFMLWSNLLWVVLLVVLLARLGHLGLLRWEAGRMTATSAAFFRRHRSALWSSGRYALGEMYIYTFPSLLVPALHGLGGRRSSSILSSRCSAAPPSFSPRPAICWCRFRPGPSLPATQPACGGAHCMPSSWGWCRRSAWPWYWRWPASGYSVFCWGARRRCRLPSTTS